MCINHEEEETHLVVEANVPALGFNQDPSELRMLFLQFLGQVGSALLQLVQTVEDQDHEPRQIFTEQAFQLLIGLAQRTIMTRRRRRLLLMMMIIIIRIRIRVMN